MKDKIHPAYDFLLVRCPTSGTEFLTRSTKLNGGKHAYAGKDVASIAVEICSDNHPFYSGKNMIIDTAGRVDAFKRRYAAAAPAAAPAKK